MKQKLKMLVKIADLQMSLWERRILDADPSYQATCGVKRDKWYDVKCRALALIAVLKAMNKFNDWNDVSKTKIPLNEEIFALLEDRMNPEKLSPAVIVAKMMPAKSISWAERTEGDVLCYDIPIGNFHCCNGAEIKYWKYVNVPSEHAEQATGTTPFDALKANIRAMVAKYVSKNGPMSEAECASLNGMSCLHYNRD